MISLSVRIKKKECNSLHLNLRTGSGSETERFLKSLKVLINKVFTHI